MKKNVPYLILLFLPIIFFWKFFLYGLLPIPADTIIGLYHPYRDFYSEEYPNGIPYKNFLITDPVRQQYPWRKFSIGQWKDGVVPGWNPYAFAGTPHIATYQSASFYPLNILLFILPFQFGWSLLIVLQPTLAAVFMYMYLKKMAVTNYGSFLGAVVYAFCGFNMVWSTWNTLGHVALWLPLILYFIETILTGYKQKQYPIRSAVIHSVLLAISGTLCVFAGHAQTVFYALCITILYLLGRMIQLYREPYNNKNNLILKKTLITCIISAAIIAVVTSVQTYPFLQFVNQSSRGLDQSHTQEGWFIPFKHLIQFATPDYFGNPATLNYWGVWNYAELVGYIGVIPLLFVIISLFFIKRRMILFYWVLVLSALVFSTDNFFARLPFVLKVPLLSTSQPTRLLFIVDFCFAVLAALGFDSVLKKKINYRRILYSSLFPILVYGFLWWSTYGQFFTKELEDSLVSRRNLYIPTFLAIIGIVFLFIYKKASARYQSIFVQLVLIVIVADLFRFGWKFTPFTNHEYLYPSTKTIDFLQSQPGIFRIMSTDDRILPPNFSMMYKLQSIDGYDPLYLRNYGELASSIVRNAPDISPFSFNRIISVKNSNHKLIDFLNVKYVLSLSDLNFPHFVKVFEEGQTKIYENTRMMPRAFLVPSVIQVGSKQEEIQILLDTSVDLSQSAVVKSQINLSSLPLHPDESVTITRYTENEVEMKVVATGKRLLVFSDVYYPNWKVYVDNINVQLHEVNYAFRGVEVPQGDHTVIFKYNLL